MLSVLRPTASKDAIKLADKYESHEKEKTHDEPRYRVQDNETSHASEHSPHELPHGGDTPIKRPSVIPNNHRSEQATYTQLDQYGKIETPGHQRLDRRNGHDEHAKKEEDPKHDL